MEYDDVKRPDHKFGKGRSQSATYLVRRGQTGRRHGKLSIFGLGVMGCGYKLTSYVRSPLDRVAIGRKVARQNFDHNVGKLSGVPDCHMSKNCCWRH